MGKRRQTGVSLVQLGKELRKQQQQQIQKRKYDSQRDEANKRRKDERKVARAVTPYGRYRLGSVVCMRRSCVLRTSPILVLFAVINGSCS